MPRPLAPLPPSANGRAFAVPHAGVTRRRSRAGDLWAFTRGTRLPVASRAVLDLCRALALVLSPAAVFTHTTAALLLGLPLPREHRNGPVHATVPIGSRAPRREGLVGHQRPISAHEMVRHRGVRVATAVRTFCDLAAILEVDALVAVGDRIVARRSRMATMAALAAAVDAMGSRRGSRRARRALALLDDGSESPKETELRLLLLGAGIGPLLTNRTLRDRGGRFVARIDLVLAYLRIAIEYEGDHHRDQHQWRRDLARRRRIEALGWIYLPVTQADLTDPTNLLSDLCAAIASRG